MPEKTPAVPEPDAAPPPLLARLCSHFGQDPGRLPVLEQQFAVYERPNLHLAIEELLQAPGRRAELVGVVVDEEYHSVTLAKMARKSSSEALDEGPVEYVDVALAGDGRLACVKRGLYLLHDEGRPLALLVSQPPHAHPPKIAVAVMAADRGHGERFLRQLTRQTRFGGAFRGHVLSLEQDCLLRDSHIEEAMDELLLMGGTLTRSLLGAAPAPAAG